MSGEPVHFVNRVEELDAARELVDALRSGTTIVFPIREYLGVGGIGKSTLLRAICHECDNSLLPYIFIDLAEFSHLSPVEWQQRILSEIIRKLPSTLEETARNNHPDLLAVVSNIRPGSPTSQTEIQTPPRTLTTQLLDLLKQYSGVLLFDTVEQASSEALEYLGQEIIFPLSDSGRVLIILASRMKIGWGTAKYKIRRRTTSITLAPFSLSHTREQLKGTSFEDITTEIQSVTSGHPASNGIVVQILSHVEEIEHRKVGRELFGDYEARLVDAVVDKVIRKNVEIPDSLFGAFCVLSILRRFDVDVPIEFLARIDRTVSWNVAILDLVQRMLHETGYLVKPNPARAGYEIDRFVRRTLSLYMRLFFPEEYLTLSRAAVDYYDREFAKLPTDVSLLVEKLYHLADIERMTHPGKYDLSVALSLRSQLRRDLISKMGDSYELPQQRLEGRAAIVGADARRRVFDQLRIALSVDPELNEDTELNERIGDIESPGFLVQVVNEVEKELLETGKAVLDIVKYQPASQVPAEQAIEEYEEYSVAFIVSQRNVDVTLPLQISMQSKEELLNDVRRVSTIDDLIDIGKVIRNQFLPGRIQDMLRLHSGPLVISVTDLAIPWELIHDGDEFIALRLPLGKRLRTAEEARIGRQRGDRQIRPLLVGVPASKVSEFGSLEHVEEEIANLKEALQSVKGLAFDPAQDVIFGQDASSYQFLKRLGSGRYDIVHFAGHAFYKEENRSGGLVLSDSVVPLDQIKRSIEGRPLVFLNACQSASDEVIEVNVGYVGSYTLGVASAFMLGGALACVGSIWKVLDSSGAKFAAQFYRQLLSGVTIGDALLTTKVQMRSDSPSERTWASYVLFGDPTVRLIIN